MDSVEGAGSQTDIAREVGVPTVSLSSFVIASPIGDEIGDAFATVRAWGYDGIELSPVSFDGLHPTVLRERADQVGLRLSVGALLAADCDLSHPSEYVRRHGLAHLRACLEFAAALGATTVSGPMYAPVGRTAMVSDAERRDQRARAAASLREAADVAGTLGVRLGIEPLNRFETDLVTTVQTGLELCDQIARDNVGLTLDTFHMNIEETSLADAIAAAAPRLVSFQVSENDRGTVGRGHVPWDETFDALRAVDYAGDIVVESFRSDTVDIATAACLWRPVADSMDDLARDSLVYVRTQLERVGMRPDRATRSSRPV